MISIFALFLPWPVNQYFVLAFTFMYFFVAVVCAPLCLSLMSYLYLLSKIVLSVYVNIVILVDSEDILLARVASYAVIMVVALEILEALLKLGRLILRNKGMISDEYEPLGRDPEQLEEAVVQKKKEVTNRMLSFLSKARNELGQLLKTRKKPAV
jgi:hypothetical protein